MRSDEAGKAALEHLGFSVRKLPELEEQKRADFIATLGDVTLLVEAKLRRDNPAELKRMNAVLAEGEVYGSTHKLGRNNSHSKNIRDGFDQLMQEREEQHDYKVLLYVADCENVPVVCEQIVDTLYGATSAFVTTNGGMKETRCYFYDPSEFFDNKDVDAAIVGYQYDDNWHLVLCLNSFSDRFFNLRSSALGQLFLGSTIDPLADEARGDAFIVGNDAPRLAGGDKAFARHFPSMDPVLRHLESKYDLPPNTVVQGNMNAPLFIVRRAGDSG